VLPALFQEEHPRADRWLESQTPKAAREFYTAKVEELGKNLQELEGIVQQKNGQLRIVEDGEFGICYCRGV